MITDRLKSHSAGHREVLPSAPHSAAQYENNRVEVSHEPTRQRERQMRGFKSAGQAQRFLTVHGVVGNLFRLGRHLTRAIHYREFRSRAFRERQEVTCAQIMA
jgi:putative transposase